MILPLLNVSVFLIFIFSDSRSEDSKLFSNGIFEIPNSTFSISAREFKKSENEYFCGTESNTNKNDCKRNINSNLSTLNGHGLAINLNTLDILINNGTLIMSSIEPIKYIKNHRELMYDIFGEENPDSQLSSEKIKSRDDQIEENIMTIRYRKRGDVKKDKNGNLQEEKDVSNFDSTERNASKIIQIYHEKNHYEEITQKSSISDRSNFVFHFDGIGKYTDIVLIMNNSEKNDKQLDIFVKNICQLKFLLFLDVEKLQSTEYLLFSNFIDICENKIENIEYEKHRNAMNKFELKNEIYKNNTTNSKFSIREIIYDMIKVQLVTTKKVKFNEEKLNTSISKITDNIADVDKKIVEIELNFAKKLEEMKATNEMMNKNNYEKCDLQLTEVVADFSTKMGNYLTDLRSASKNEDEIRSKSMGDMIEKNAMHCKSITDNHAIVIDNLNATLKVLNNEMNAKISAIEKQFSTNMYILQERDKANSFLLTQDIKSDVNEKIKNSENFLTDNYNDALKLLSDYLFNRLDLHSDTMSSLSSRVADIKEHNSDADKKDIYVAAQLEIMMQMIHPEMTGKIQKLQTLFANAEEEKLKYFDKIVPNLVLTFTEVVDKKTKGANNDIFSLKENLKKMTIEKTSQKYSETVTNLNLKSENNKYSIIGLKTELSLLLNKNKEQQTNIENLNTKLENINTKLLSNANEANMSHEKTIKKMVENMEKLTKKIDSQNDKMVKTELLLEAQNKKIKDLEGKVSNSLETVNVLINVLSKK